MKTEKGKLAETERKLIEKKDFSAVQRMPGLSFNKVLQAWFKIFHDRYGGLIFVAAGNGGRHFDFNTMDANMHNIMVVAALDRKMEIAKFSNVPVLGAAEGAAGKFNFRALKAPGDDIVCKDAQLKHVSVSGTSAATAVMSGLAALGSPNFPASRSSRFCTVMGRMLKR